MELKITDHKDINIIHLEGRMDVRLSGDIEAELVKLIDTGVSKMIMDVQQFDCLSPAEYACSLPFSGNSRKIRGKSYSAR